jgi:polygalacturonase
MEDKNEKSSVNRRNFLGGFATAAAGFTLFPDNLVKGIDNIEHIGSVNLPAEKPLPIFNVLNFGLAGDGVTLNTKPFQTLIDSCSENGGGTLFFPPGDFLTGTFQIKDNVNIYLSPGSTVWGSKNRSDYSKGCLVYAEDAKNISMTGMGTINGNGKSFWEDLIKQKLSEEQMREKMWRPGNMMQFVRCNNLLLQDITVANSPAWTIRPIDCERVTITGISILNGIYEEDGPNTDGINPDGCSKVRISDCYIQCGDDCIVLKITDLSKTKVCRDVVVTNCVLTTTETGLKIGTETFGEFRNITFSNCVVHDSGGGFGLLMRDGGLIDGMVVSNISVDCTRIKNGQGIYIWSHRRTDTTPWGMIKNVIISNFTITGGGGIFIDGAKEKHIQGLTLENIRINVTGGRNTKYHENPPHPFTVFGHRVAPYDIFCRYVDDLKLRNIQIIWPESEDAKLGSAIRCWTVKDLELAGFAGRQSLKSKAPAIWLKDVNGAFIHGCRAPEGTGTLLQLDEGTKKVSIIGNEFSQAKVFYSSGSGVDAKEIFETANHLPT